MDQINSSFSGSIHTHSYFSRYDSTASVKDLAKRAKELGAESLAFTDHGTLIGIWDALDACKNVGIKGVPGCELYVMNPSGSDDDEDEENDSSEDAIGKREHLIVLCKNLDGWHALSKCVSDSNHNIVGQKPITTVEMLKKWFGPGSTGHGNVIATSACMAGVLCSKILVNVNASAKQEKLRKKMEKETNPANSDYVKLLSAVSTLNEKIEKAEERKKIADGLAKTTYKNRYKIVLKEGDPEKIAELEKEIERIKAATKQLPVITEEIKKLKKELKPYKDSLKKADISVERFNKLQEEINVLESVKESPEQSYAKAEETLGMYLDIFGKDNFFVEVQYHGIEEEKDSMPKVAEIARKHNVPLVASNDIHNVYKEDAEARACIFAQKYFWKDVTETEQQLYMKTDDELKEYLLKILSEDVVNEAISNIRFILDKCNVSFPEETHYPKYPGETSGIVRLKNLCAENKRKKIPEWNTEYERRYRYELSVINKLGFADYLCIVEDFLNYGRLIGKIDVNDERFKADPFNLELLAELGKNSVGDGVGPGRGSAVGSLICYLMGITNLDPIKNNLLFERFLNPERVTMPDIDSDIAIDKRGYVIDYIRHRYGDNAVCQIMTQGFLAAKAAIKAATRVRLARLGITKQNNPDEYSRLMNLGDELSKSVDDFASLADSKDALEEIASKSEDGSEILRMARLLEGKFCNIGTHAAGVIISDNSDVSDYVPLLNVGGVIASQCDKERTENLGLLKMDVLGLRNLSIITDTERAIFNSTGKKISIDDIPFEKEVFENIFSTGNTNNVFQFESDGMKRVLTGFRPESFDDLVLLVALYRPGPAQYIDSITAVKNTGVKPKYIIPEMEEILGVTYGKPVFQEQIMSIFNKFAGFSLGEADIIRRYMAKKKVDKFMAYKEKFVEGMISRGGDKEEVESFWNELLDFASYAFNKSHAAAYAYISYATAWLKYHYPEAYAIGILNYESTQKIQTTLKSVVASGVKIYCPDINHAKEGFSLYEDGIMFGLGSIAQMPGSAIEVVKERELNGPFKSFEDFLLRTNVKSDAINNLIKGGAFDFFNKNRSYLAMAYIADQPLIKRIRDIDSKLAAEHDEKKISMLKDRREKTYNELFEEKEPVHENLLEKLEKENEALGYYVSMHPIDTAKIPENLKVVNLCDFEKIASAPTEKEKYANIVVFASNLRIKKTKASGAEFAIFDIEDKTGISECVCFPKQFEKFRDVIYEGGIFQIGGKIRKNERDRITFDMNFIKAFESDLSAVKIHVPSFEAWERKKEIVLPYSGSYSLVVISDEGGSRRTEFKVSKDIENAKFDWS